MDRPVLLFDFDGTIADSINVMIEVYNSLAPEFGRPALDSGTIEMLRGKSAREVFKLLGIPLFKIPFLLRRGLNDIQLKRQTIKPITGIIEVISELHKKYNIGILSSSSEELIKNFLVTNHLEYFNYIYAGSSIFGKSRMLNRFVKDTQISREKLIYIGDEVRDIEATNKAGIPIISVTWGFNSKEILQKYKPDYLVDQPSQLLAVIAEFMNPKRL